jgi:tetratricopeptide (TPR) repeat protein
LHSAPSVLAAGRHLLATHKGWCELDSFLEANAELDQVKPECRAHPDVLEARWQVYANLEKWEGALESASVLMRTVPGKPEGFLYTASSLQELGRSEEAFQTLMKAVNRFPSDEIVLFDLACLCCMLGRAEEARNWLSKAIEVGGEDIKLRAMDDPDLQPIWNSGT